VWVGVEHLEPRPGGIKGTEHDEAFIYSLKAHDSPGGAVTSSHDEVRSGRKIANGSSQLIAIRV